MMLHYLFQGMICILRGNFRFMQISIEQINLNAQRSFQAYEYDFASQDQMFHAHDEFELATVVGTGGLLYCGAETTLFSSGDIFLFGRRLPHRFIRQPGESTARVIQFRMDAFGEGFFGLPENLPIRTLLDRSAQGLAFPFASTQAAGRLAAVIQADTSRRIPELLLLLAELSESAGRGEAVSLSPGGVVIRSRGVDEERLSRLQDFIESEYAGNATLDAAAETLALTRTSFCRYVKRVTGRTFTELVNDYRLTAAAMMLRDSGAGTLSVAAVSGDAGFGSLSHFNSRFKERFGITPKEYRETAAAGEVNKKLDLITIN
ncbi:MAG: hypothetical protein DRP70_10675 [Spirochaetes bacterium]|nr:MAG: hypothetical protein DRP70_10675 [Spirochaetota bacterium]